MFAYVIIYPINICLFLLIIGPKGMQNKTIKSYFGSLYDALNVEYLINTQAVTIFLVRRLIIGFSIALFRQYYFLQLEILIVTCLSCASFTILTMPYKIKLNNVIEVLNEIMVMFTVYIMHGFSYFIPSLGVRYTVGWIYICIVVAIVLMNISMTIHQFICFIIEKSK